ncbi:hypothetical protein [Streptomyces sp. PR69]|uniref:hypothetical protein n=1 Tax=Streptomyces sp. PR69 TaxID=2984950 RepID=UPI002263BEE4|nr:hypothetical protein [Streptomyces sp. PR69]
MMNTGRLSLAAATLTLAALTALTALTAVPSANAAPAGESAPRPTAAPVSAAAPDGHLHAYFDINFRNYCGGWVGNAGNWGQCRNKASSLWNNGYPGNLDDVWVHWDTGCRGARRGVHNGVALADLRRWTFDRNTGPGSGEALNDNISSHCWTNLP